MPLACLGCSDVSAAAAILADFGTIIMNSKKLECSGDLVNVRECLVCMIQNSMLHDPDDTPIIYVHLDFPAGPSTHTTATSMATRSP